MAMVFVLVLVLLMVTSWILGLSSMEATRQDNALQNEQQAYLLRIQGALKNWYQQHAAAVEASTAPINIVTVLSTLGFPLKWHVTGASSHQLIQNNIAYHVFAVWIPGSAAASASMDLATGIFTPGSAKAYELVDGFTLESGLVLQTTRTLQKDANRLQEMFRADTLQDEQHQINWNHFRAQDCSQVESDEMPCLDTYVALNQARLHALAGLDPSDEWDAWGSFLQVSNLLDSNTHAPPYTMALESVTPWGAIIRIFAIQPL